MNHLSWASGLADTGVPYDPPPEKRWAFYASHVGDYMRRWIIRTPWGALHLHHIVRPDSGQDHHDHPWHFASLVLSGGYVEELLESGHRREILHTAGSLVLRMADQAHRIRLVAPRTFTLVLVSPKVRSIGFHTAEGWIPWRDYVARIRS